MKKKLNSTLFLISVCFIISCSNSEKTKDSGDLVVTNLGNYSIALPENFNIAYYNSDSINGKIQGNDFSIDFAIGSIPSSLFKLNEEDPEIKLIRNDSVGNFVYNILSMKDTKGETLTFLLGDNTSLSSMFGDERLDGITLSGANLNLKQKELTLKIFETIKLRE